MIHCVLVWFLKPRLLSENDGTLNQQLEACRSMPQHAAASQNFLGDRWCLLAGPQEGRGEVANFDFEVANFDQSF